MKDKNKKPSLVDFIRSKLIDTSLGNLKNAEAENEHSNGGDKDEQ
jgi:hypothetical protein